MTKKGSTFLTAHASVTERKKQGQRLREELPKARESLADDEVFRRVVASEAAGTPLKDIIKDTEDILHRRRVALSASPRSTSGYFHPGSAQWSLKLG
jgi:hypothetical protein